jgi:hypothetical protein
MREDRLMERREQRTPANESSEVQESTRTPPKSRGEQRRAGAAHAWWDRNVVRRRQRLLEHLAKKVLALGPLEDDEEVIAPSSRDLHLFPLADAMLPLLRNQRLNVLELLAVGRRSRPGLFDEIDEDFAWRCLTYCERRRWVTPLNGGVGDPSLWLWDLTPDGLTQISTLRILTERAKFGGVLAIAGFGAFLFGKDDKKVVGIAFGVLVVFGVWAWAQFGIERWFTGYAGRAIRAREATLHSVMSRNHIAPWWPPLHDEAQTRGDLGVASPA